MAKTPNDTDTSRRPIAARDSSWATRFARWLSTTGITPNQISMMSMGFALLALVFYVIYGQKIFVGHSPKPFATSWPLLAAALAIQGRLLCNLFDGMVAMEGGKASKDGPFWNEFPDRASDMFILVGASLAAGVPMLGWIAAGLAVFVAYVRELGRANGLPADFSGPMAKPHRMVILTLASLLAMLEPLWTDEAVILKYSLMVIAIGCVITIIRRAYRQVKALKQSSP